LAAEEYKLDLAAEKVVFLVIFLVILFCRIESLGFFKACCNGFCVFF